MNRLLRAVASISAIAAFTLGSAAVAAAARRPAGGSFGAATANVDAGRHAQGQSGVIRWLGIDCAATDSCYAVGFQFSGALNGGHGIVVQIQDGIAGSPQVVPGVDDLARIACVSAETCYAVGYSSGGALVPLIDGQPGTPVPLGTLSDQVGLGCTPDGTICYAVSSSSAARGGVGVVVPIAAGQVEQQVMVPDVEGFEDVACPTNDVCYASGSRSSAGGDEAVIVPLTGDTAGTPVAVDGLEYLESIVCPSADICYATGGGASGDTAIITLTDGAVTSSAPLTPPIQAGVLGCLNTTTCFIIGSQGAAGGGPGSPVVVTLTDGAPANTQMAPAQEEFHDIACLAGGTCIVVGEDDSTGGQGSAQGLVLTVTGGIVGQPQFTPYSGS
jgi:hypothetical protein